MAAAVGVSICRLRGMRPGDDLTSFLETFRRSIMASLEWPDLVTLFLDRRYMNPPVPVVTEIPTGCVHPTPVTGEES